jgi:ankyrin repeat protein
VNALDDAGVTPLMVCAVRGHNYVAKALLEAGANVHAACPAQRTALHVAAFYGRTDVLPVLLAAVASPETLCVDGLLPLHYLCPGTSDSKVRYTSRVRIK